MIRPRRSKWRSLYLWHRYMGLMAASLVIPIAISGLLLNHTERLRLDERFLSSPILLDLYRIPDTQTIRSFATNGSRVSQVGDWLYLDQTRILQTEQTLVGAVQTAAVIVIALEQSVLLIDHHGELIEHQDQSAGLPDRIEQIGLDAAQRPVLKADSGLMQSDADFLSWRSATQAPPEWSSPSSAPQALQLALQADFRGHILTLERFMLDLHSGRLFGTLGIWLYDAAAILLLSLALSGVWIWNKQRRKHH